MVYNTNHRNLSARPSPLDPLQCTITRVTINISSISKHNVHVYTTTRVIVHRMTSSATFKIQLSLRRSHDDGAVFRKQDGGRFDKSVTLKLNANTNYCLSVTTRPARAVRHVLLKCDKLELQAQKSPRHEDNCLVYHADWSTTGSEVNKSCSRVYLPIVIELEDGSCVDTSLQVKIYPETETTHSKWGQEFHLLDLDCVCKPGQMAICVQKEEYL